MNLYGTDPLSLLRGKELTLSPSLSVKHPTLSDIEELGYDRYSEFISSIVSNALDMADILWFEMGIWYEDIKSDWDFFVQKSASTGKETILKMLDNNGKIDKVESNCICMGIPYRDALNYFLGTTGEYVLLEQVKNDMTQTIAFNAKVDNYGMCSIDSKSLKFTQHYYGQMCNFLRDLNWLHPNYEFTKGGTKKAKAYILKQDYKQRSKKSNKESRITLDSIVSSVMARCNVGMDIWNYPIYTVYNLYYRLVKIDEYQNTIDALHNGCIDTKKNPVNWEKINWSNVI